MLNTIVHTANVLHNAFGWLMNEIVQDVPEPIAVCEFDCRKTQCTFAEWASCERRLKKAAGELMPPSRSTVTQYPCSHLQ
jgi:curli biogenesis system outer membrane secretion channel CsgG